MPTTDGACPYCGCDCFVSAATIEVTPLQHNPPAGEWKNQCAGCKQWSVHRIGPNGFGTQEELPASEWPT